ncbi:MAG: phytoene desaturase family protein [Candidatus Cyclobacteriaceae bacterium M2_1C_046]
MTKKINVIGAGFAGLSVSACLAAKGYDVTVIEKHDQPGGRARQFTEKGFVFDMGPSWYWMPDVFEHFFQRFGKSTSDYYKLVRLDPSYRIFFEDGVMDVPANLDDLRALFEEKQPGSTKHLNKFIEEAAYKYELGMNRLVYKPGQSLKELFDTDIIKGIFKLHVFTSVSKYIRRYFKHPHLIKLLEFPVLFLGATADETPALYTLMNYADLKLGTWYPKGGMYQIVNAMHQVAIDNGVKFEFDQNVKKLEVQNKRIIKIITEKTEFTGDITISAADYNFVDQYLLNDKHKQYTKEYWQKRVMAPSSIIFYLGIKGKVNKLLHHNLFFDEDFVQHSKDIYKHNKYPDDPLFYVSCPSKTDDLVAPAGDENLFILIPIASDLHDNEDIRMKYFEKVMKRLEKHTGENIKDRVIYKKSFSVNDFKNEYNSFRGNAYGLANTLLQTANLKPSMVSKKVNNLIYTGQLTVPGPGVPPSIISGQVAADLVIKKFK